MNLKFLCHAIEFITQRHDLAGPTTPVPFVSAITTSSALFHAGAPRVMTYVDADTKLWALLERTPTIEFTLNVFFKGQDITDEFVKHKLERLRCERFGFQVQTVYLEDCAVTDALIPFFAGIPSLQKLVFEKCPAMLTEDTLCSMMDRTEKKCPMFIVEAALAALLTDRVSDRPPILYSRRLVTSLVALLDFPKYEVQFGVLSLLADVSFADAATLRIIADLGCIPKAISFFDVCRGNWKDEQLCDQAAWFLCNAASLDAAMRDQVLDAGIMQPLLACLEDPDPLSSSLHAAASLVSQLCRHQLPLDKLKLFLPVIRRLLEHSDTDVQGQACWAISYLFDGPDEQTITVHEALPDFLNIMLQLLETRRETVVLPAISAFRNYAAKSADMAQTIIDLGVLSKFAQFLVPAVSSGIRREICFTAFILTSLGLPEQIQTVIDAGLMPGIVSQLRAEPEVQCEAMDVVHAVCARGPVAWSGRKEFVRYLVEELDVLRGIKAVLSTIVIQARYRALRSLERLFELGDEYKEANDGRNPYVDKFEEIGGPEDLFVLTTGNLNNAFAARVIALAEKYFEGHRSCRRRP